MSADSSAPNPEGETVVQKLLQPKGWGVLAGTLLAILAFLGPQFLAIPLLPLLEGADLSQNAKLFILQAFVQAMTVGMILVIIRSYHLNLSSIGLSRFKPKKVIGWAFLVFPAYLLVSVLAANVLATFVSPELINQEQDLAFASPGGVELLLVLLALVVIAPIVEEIIFRGFLFRAYRQRFGVVLGAVLVSVLFGLAHAQLNVGVDTFVLSLFLCYIRVKTGSLWAPIVLHATKNFVAFWFLFIIGTK